MDLAGKRVVITGAAGGIGTALCCALHGCGARLVLAVHDEGKGLRLARELPGAQVEPVEMGELSSIETFAARVGREPIDVLVLGAGVYRQPRRNTPDGLESTMAVNWLGPVYLTALLLPALQAAENGKVVAVTSLAARYCRFDESDPQALRERNLTKVYALSKRALSLCMLEMDGMRGVRCFLAHPGVCATGLFSLEKAAFPQWFLRMALPMMRRIFMPPEKAMLSVYLACMGILPPRMVAGPGGLLGAWGTPAARPLAESGEEQRQAWNAARKLLTEGGRTQWPID